MVRSFSQRDGLFAVMDCVDWDDFRLTFRDVLKSTSSKKSISDRFVFRGQSCADWKLISNFDRSNKGLSAAERDRKYHDLIALFKENYKAYGGLSGSDVTDFINDIDNLPIEKIEAIAQHYGLGTRLVDWSFSPYVAAFFALSRIDLCLSGKISIWSLDKDIFSEFSKSEVDFFRDLYRRNVRNLWQMGAFTRNTTSTPDLVDLFRSASASYNKALTKKPPPLIRFDIPVAHSAEILDDLQLMRINSMTIFPGLEGVISWLQKKP